MKECFRCGVAKPLSDFYRHSRMADGHLNKCKQCTKADVAQHREDNIEKIREYDRNRPNQNQRKASHKYKPEHQVTKRAWALRNPEKRKAQWSLRNAVRDGKVLKKSHCEHCSTISTKLQGHHWSYKEEHWLDVIWLCTKCHGAEHRRLNQLGRDPDKPSEEI